MTPPVPEMFVTEMAVSLLPLGHPAWYDFTLFVQSRNLADDRWAVCWRTRCLGRTNGKWSYEPQPSSRDDEWLAEYRHTFEEAVEAATRTLPTLRIGKVSAQDIIDGKVDWQG